MLKIIIFFIFSLIIIKISWPDIFDTNSRKFYRSFAIVKISWTDIFGTNGHKFYRFFAIEFLFLLILVNFGYWLKNPFTIFRMITWIILCSSFLLAGFGIYHLLQGGKPEIRSNIETTTNLVTYGIYKYIRHPLYSSLILLGAVTLIKNPSLLATSLFSVATVFLYTTARTEEKENILKFGRDYAVYMRRTSMFFPFLS
jgi:protein-S-isoprenylcysteine O-methyltransferase Ste14